MSCRLLETFNYIFKNIALVRQCFIIRICFTAEFAFFINIVKILSEIALGIHDKAMRMIRHCFLRKAGLIKALVTGRLTDKNIKHENSSYV